MEVIQTNQTCKCPHHRMVPLFVVILGLLFLLHALGIFSDSFTMIVWPIIVIIIGLQKMFSHKCKCCGAMHQ